MSRFAVADRRSQRDATGHQLATFYPDLRDLVRGRRWRWFTRGLQHVSSWGRAHPYRYLCSNSVNNMARGNIN
jgi:hypothetical protein